MFSYNMVISWTDCFCEGCENSQLLLSALLCKRGNLSTEGHREGTVNEWPCSTANHGQQCLHDCIVVCVCACVYLCVYLPKCYLVDQSGPWQAYHGKEEVCEETAEGKGEGG